jgi:hypothetical protein
MTGPCIRNMLRRYLIEEVFEVSDAGDGANRSRRAWGGDGTIDDWDELRASWQIEALW